MTWTYDALALPRDKKIIIKIRSSLSKVAAATMPHTPWLLGLGGLVQVLLWRWDRPALKVAYG